MGIIHRTTQYYNSEYLAVNDIFDFLPEHTQSGWRHGNTMKRRISLYASIIFIVIAFGGIWFFATLQNRETLQVFPATVNRDCAPWDGTAFTVSIPLNNGAIIDISIYRSPDIRLPVTYSFPDETMRDGNALLLLPTGLPEQLTGKVWFQRVEKGVPVEGTFDFLTETGRQFEGRFKANWENQAVYCG